MAEQALHNPSLILDRSEFLVLLDAVQASKVAGLDMARLIPADKAQHRALILAGLAALKQRGLLRQEGDVTELEPYVLALAAAVGHPPVAVVSRKDTPGAGSQLFLHYLAPPVIVEQTLPDESHHRLLRLADMPTLIERLLGIFPVQPGSGLASEPGVLTLDAFLSLKQQAESGDLDSARSAARAGGLSAAGAASLVNALAQPVFGGNLALLKLAGDEVVDARNLAVVQGQDSGWLIKQTMPGAQTFDILAADGLEARKLLVQWFAELAAGK